MNYKLLYLVLAYWIFTFTACVSKDSSEERLKFKSIDRFASLLHSSTLKSPKDVSILFYGQSIVAGLKSDILVDSLRSYFPSANITFSNTAIGGFTAPSLIKTANHDIYQNNPDLIIFHAYDDKGEKAFDSLIKTIRQQSSADIALFDHHYSWNNDSLELAKTNERDSLQSVSIKKIAARFDCKYINVRDEWKKYLEENAITANILIGNTKDNDVHPNELGKELLRDIILKNLIEENGIPYIAEKDLLRKNILLNRKKVNKIDFVGNRVEMVLDSVVEANALIQVLIDGKPPSAFRNSFFITRPSKGYKSWMPALKLVTLGETQPRPEDWKLIITNMDRENKRFSYKVEGSITGFDGVGDSETDFVSDSKRIKINKEDFYLFRIEEIIGENTPENFEIEFSVVPIVEDYIQLRSKRQRYTVFRDFKKGYHVLTLKTVKGKTFPKELIVYQPYLVNDK